MRDGLFLSLFPVQSLPYFMAGAAILAIVASQLSGRLLARLGPVRVAPALVASNAALFLVEWVASRLAAAGGGGAPVLHIRRAGRDRDLLLLVAAQRALRPAFGEASDGACGGGGCVRRLRRWRERRARSGPSPCRRTAPAARLSSAQCPSPARWPWGRAGLPGAPTSRTSRTATGIWAQLQQQPLLRDLALVIALAAMLGALVDYILKAEAVALFRTGSDQLVRFFGLFYSVTGLAAWLIQASLGRVALERLGLGGSVGSHAAAVGVASLLGFVLPAPWRGIVPRGLDAVVRNSTFRAGYELLYTPLAESAKRSAKSVIDVACDCAGKGAGAILILLLVGLAPLHPSGRR